MPKNQVEKAIEILKKGGVAAFPTDTVYGLGCAYDDVSSAERIYRIKDRPLNMALPVLVSDAAMLEKIAAGVSPEARLLIKSFKPGLLTLVVKKSSAVPDIVTGGGRTVAVRITAHPVPLALIKGIGKPIVATSANRHGLPTALTADDVRSQIGGEIDLLVEGECPVGVESTIIDVSRRTPRIVRRGALSSEEIQQVCPVIE